MFDAALSPRRDELHILMIVARSRRAALLAAEDVLAATDAELCRMNLKPVGEVVEATLKLKGLDQAAAQRLADRACGHLGVSTARVEHLWELK